MERIIETWHDLMFTVTAEVHDHHVDFNLYEVTGFMEAPDGTWTAPIWERVGATSSGDDAETLDDAEVFASGYVKWDGCSNWHFPSTERCMYHGCGRGDLQKIGDALARCWDWAATLCPHWNADVAGPAKPFQPPGDGNGR